MYAIRSYYASDGLISTRVRVKETDLHILADRDMADLARDLVVECRLQLETYISKSPRFASSLTPLPLETVAPPIIREMLQAGIDAGVGPMAAVAGVV